MIVPIIRFRSSRRLSDVVEVLLDVNTVSYVVSNRHPEVRESFLAHSHESGISVISYAEALFGARKKNAVKLESLIGVFCDMIAIRPGADVTASAYVDIRAQLEADGTPIGALDMEIAVAAKSIDAILATNNTRHFSHLKGLIDAAIK